MSEKILGIAKKQLESQKNDGCLSGIIESKKIGEITEEDAFELLKIFVGTDNPYFKLLSIASLTLVKPGFATEETVSLKYVYNWGSSLIQIFFYSAEKLNFSVKIVD